MTIIQVFGDSIVYGAWDKEQQGWVNRLRIYLDKKNNDDEIYNFGVSGDTSADLLKRFDAECRSSKTAIGYGVPLVILIAIGTNDSSLTNGQNRVGKEMFISNLQELINAARKYTNKIFFLEILPVEESKTSPESTNAFIDEYNLVLHKICKKNEVELIKTHDAFMKEHLSEDGLHPNSAGHELICNAVTQTLVKRKIIG